MTAVISLFKGFHEHLFLMFMKSFFCLMTLVSFVRGAYETRKPRASTRGWNSFSDKNSFRYTNKWLPT
ncbi:hypothetical protein, partial [Enterococcus raffinosus]